MDGEREHVTPAREEPSADEHRSEGELGRLAPGRTGARREATLSWAPADVTALQRAAGNALVARLLAPSRRSVAPVKPVPQRAVALLQRHPLEEAVEDSAAGTNVGENQQAHLPEGDQVELAELTEREDDEEFQRLTMVGATPRVIQRKSKKSVGEVRFRFDALAQSGSTGPETALNYLKRHYKLDGETYELKLEPTSKASNHAETWGGKDMRRSDMPGVGPDTPIAVVVNPAYLARVLRSDRKQGDPTFIKLIHTLVHEYQHVKQRGVRGWNAAGKKQSEKGVREFQAYSYELLDSEGKKGTPSLEPRMIAKTLNSARVFGWNLMDAAQKGRYRARADELERLGRWIAPLVPGDWQPPTYQ